MKKTPGTDGAWGLLCIATLRNENEQVQQPWRIARFQNSQLVKTKRKPVQQPWHIYRFQNEGGNVYHRLPVQQPWHIYRFQNCGRVISRDKPFSNRGTSTGSKTPISSPKEVTSSATVAHLPVPKREGVVAVVEQVQQPWHIYRFQNGRVLSPSLSKFSNRGTSTGSKTYAVEIAA